MLIRSTDTLHYPIKVTKLIAKTGSNVARFDTLFKYTYSLNVTEGDKYGEEKLVERTFPADFKSETEGTLGRWEIAPGQVLTKAGASLVTIDEPCTHEETFGNLCTNCGVDVTKLDNYLTSKPNSERATINTAHTNTALKTSHRLANKRGEEATRRLLDSRKLSLVVDLDQTIIHATVDPTVAEWKKDPSNPNYEAVKDVEAFQLVDDGPGMRGCWYYIKLRPGLQTFLEEIAKTYELHIYTMGTRAYAQNIAKIVDPKQKIFGDRILSRDESGSMTSKSLQRLFPTDTDMVVIIDDRGDVWNWSPNLVKVTAYDFFVGIGDINSSFLPKAQGVVAKPMANDIAPEINGGLKFSEMATEDGHHDAVSGIGEAPTDDDAAIPSILESQLVAMAGAVSEEAIEAQTVAQDQVIASQVEDRPLARKQEKLDQMDDTEELNAESSDTASDHSQKQRHNLLRDDDEELRWLQLNLEHVHQAFFDEFDRQKKTFAAGRVADLRGDKTSPKKPALVDDLALVPDVKQIMPAMKEQVLTGVVLCFTGVIPQGIDHNTSDIGMWARSFGARISPNLTKSTTHVVAHKDRRTSKVRQASQHPRIQIVAVSWLLECFTRWQHVDEGPHLIEFEQDHGPHDSLPFEEFENGIMLTPSEDGVDLTELPEDADDLQSPTSFEGGDVDWDDMDKEFEDFMGSDMESDFDDGTDNDSDASNASNQSGLSNGSQRRKRKRAATASVEGESEGPANGTSNLQKRKKRALERSTGLANVTVVEQTSGLPSPDATGPEEEESKEVAAEDAEGDDGRGADADLHHEEDEDDEFSKAFIEAMESASEHEHEEEQALELKRPVEGEKRGKAGEQPAAG